MARVYIAERSDAAIDGQEPVARFAPGGVYSFLSDEFQELHKATGELIHPDTDSYFSGEDLAELERLIAGTFERVVCQASAWDQPVGTTDCGGTTTERTSRNDVVAFLRQLAAAARIARERESGVLIRGDGLSRTGPIAS